MPTIEWETISGTPVTGALNNHRPMMSVTISSISAKIHTVPAALVNEMNRG
jgi:hypothetical protein